MPEFCPACTSGLRARASARLRRSCAPRISGCERRTALASFDSLPPAISIARSMGEIVVSITDDNKKCYRHVNNKCYREGWMDSAVLNIIFPFDNFSY